LYIRGENGKSLSPFIAKVYIYLHPTFHPSKIVLTQEPFEISRTGWGTFEIDIQIQFTPSVKLPPFSTSHQLSFTRHDTFTEHMYNIDTREFL